MIRLEQCQFIRKKQCETYTVVMHGILQCKSATKNGNFGTDGIGKEIAIFLFCLEIVRVMTIQ